MAHFAKIENNIVCSVIVISDEDCMDDDTIGQNFINNVLQLDGIWKRTSYNTFDNKNINGGKPFRKNYAGLGYTYDEELDAFIPPKPYPSWILDEEKGNWYAPIPFPLDNKMYQWCEEKIEWTLIQNMT